MKRLLLTLAVIFSCFLFIKTNASAEEVPTLPQAGYPAWAEEIETNMNYISTEYPRYFLSEEDEDLLLRVAVLEAGESDVEGIAHVMQVVLNRWDSDLFPNEIRDVVFQPGQFSTAHRLGEANITEAAGAALESVVWGEYLHNKALYFESLPGVVWGSYHKYLFSYGGHDFYEQ